MPASENKTALEDLISLNDEIAALVRAGLPLELGLAGFGGTMRGRMARAVEELAVRMNSGASLPQALEADSSAFPRVYRAVVDAGLRSGRLPEALETLASYSRAMLELRRRIGLALLYPLIVVIVAYMLFILFIGRIVPVLEQGYLSIIEQKPRISPEEFQFRMLGEWWSSLLDYLHETLPYWGPGIPVFVVALYFSGFVARRTLFPKQAFGGWCVQTFGCGAPFSWLPRLRPILFNHQLATFSELLSLLVQHETPLPEALTLAGDASGSVWIDAETTQIADDVRGGKSLADSLKSATVLPKYFRWMLKTGESHGALYATLKQVSQTYRRKAVRLTDWFRVLFPFGLIVLIAGGVTLLYALTMFLPLINMLWELSVR